MGDNQSRYEVEELWLTEAKRRLDELHAGKVNGIDADEAFKEASETLLAEAHFPPDR